MLQTFGCMKKQEMILERECEREKAGKERHMRERGRETEAMEMERERKEDLGVGGQMKW